MRDGRIRRFADARQTRHLRDLAHRVGVETPRVVWRFEADEAIRRLEKNLLHLQQPTLFDDPAAARCEL